MGSTGQLSDGWQVVVTGISPDAWTGIQASVLNDKPPAADQKDFVIGLLATFQGSGSGVFSGFRFDLITPSGTIYDQVNNNCGVIPNPIPPNLMTPGGQVRGNICFTVRTSDSPSVVMFDNQPDPNARVYFLLH
jgi:hypothetical protein